MGGDPRNFNRLKIARKLAQDRDAVREAFSSLPRDPQKAVVKWETVHDRKGGTRWVATLECGHTRTYFRLPTAAHAFLSCARCNQPPPKEPADGLP